MMQETDRTKKCYTNTDSISKCDIADKPTVNKKLFYTIDYFLPGPSCDSDKTVSVAITQFQRDFEDVFNRIGYFDGTFLLQQKPYSKPYQVPLCVWCTCYKHLLKRNEKGYRIQDIITLLGVDETAEWCNSFVLVPKANG